MSDEKKLPDEQLDKVSGGVAREGGGHHEEDLEIRDRSTTGATSPPTRHTNPRIEPP